MTPRKLEIIQAYKKYGNLRLAAGAVGITRQRVQQVVSQSTDPIVVRMRQRIDHSQEHCSVCQRPFTEIHYQSKGKCSACYQADRYGNKTKRRLFLPRACVACGRPFGGHKEVKLDYRRKRNLGNLCFSCYAKTDRYKAYQRKYHAKPEIKLKKNRAFREYYKKNKEFFSEYYKQYYIKKKL